jgi:hypothetical protein
MPTRVSSSTVQRLSRAPIGSTAIQAVGKASFMTPETMESRIHKQPGSLAIKERMSGILFQAFQPAAKHSPDFVYLSLEAFECG